MKLVTEWKGHRSVMHVYLRGDRGVPPTYDINPATRLNNIKFWSIPANYAYVSTS